MVDFVVEALRLEGYDNSISYRSTIFVVVEALRLEGYDNDSKDATS